VKLTQRQRDVVALLVAGLSQREIRERLQIRRETLRFHIRTLGKRIPGPGSAMRRVLLHARDLLDEREIA
jgi:FixJ family two-component response regulator